MKRPVIFAVLALLVADAAVSRSAGLAQRWSVPAERAISWTLVVALAVVLSLVAREATRGLSRSQLAPLACACAAILLILTRAIEPDDGAWSVTLTRAFAPLTVWPALIVMTPIGHAVLTLGRVILLVPESLLAAVCILRLSGRGALAGATAASVSACPGCVPLATLALPAAWAAPFTDPLSPLASLLALGTPALFAAAALPPPSCALERPARTTSMFALGIPVIAAAWWDLPSGDSQQSRALHALFQWYNVPGILIAILVLGFILVAVLRFRRRRGAHARRATARSKSTRGWQIVFVVAPTILLVILGVVSVRTDQALAHVATDAPHVEVTGMQWAWQARYANNSTTTDEIHLVAGQDTILDVTSPDVTHSLFVPDLGIRIDAVPGRINHAHVLALHSGTYDGVCAEFCGYAHPRMTLKVVVT